MTGVLGAFLPERVSEFQAFWYFGVLLGGIGVLAGIGSWLTCSALRPLWRSSDRSIAVLLTAVTATMVVLLLAMGAAALVGLANHPGTGAGAR
ncbi:MAG: hypothetical protein ABR564_08195 [Candidatus Dormibacteria bacterium]